MKILVTGAAGFIGAFLTNTLASEGHDVTGIDNINDYYDVNLKYARLRYFEFDCNKMTYGCPVVSGRYPHCQFVRMDITDKKSIDQLFESSHFDIVCHLAAQAGVRYSIENPYTYIQSNIIGLMNILEACRHHHPQHLIFASSSSIYGQTNKVPYSEDDKTDMPVSLYAATKKSDELLAYSYSKLYNLPITGLRFFTVYGPWGRPDMAPYLFMDSIICHRPIRVFNYGDMQRDFTYIMDIVRGTSLVIPSPPKEEVPFQIYNIGNAHPVQLMDFIHTLEEVTGEKAECHFVEMQPGDVTITYADVSKLQHDFGYKPLVSLRTGIERLFHWYLEYKHLSVPAK